MRPFPRGHEKYLFHQSAKKRLSTTEDQFKGEKSSKLNNYPSAKKNVLQSPEGKEATCITRFIFAVITCCPLEDFSIS